MNKRPDCGEEFEQNIDRRPECYAGSEEGDGWIYLTTVSNDIESEIMSGILQMGEIPVIKKVNGIDGYLKIILGTPVAGIDLYVPRDKYTEAYELINAEVDEAEFLAEEESSEGK